MSVIYSFITLCFILSLAWWEAELIKEGKSNHTPKFIWLILCLLLYFLSYYEYSMKKQLIVIGIFITEYFALYDYALNFIRKVPDPFNYKLFGKPWMKFIALLVLVFLNIYYFLA